MSTSTKLISAVLLETILFSNGTDFYAEYTEVAGGLTFSTRQTLKEVYTRHRNQLKKLLFKA